MRNTRVIDMVREFESLDAQVDVYDPWASSEAAGHEYGVSLISELEPDSYDAIVLAVAHSEFRELGIDRIRALGRTPHVIYDIKNLFDRRDVDGRL